MEYTTTAVMTIDEFIELYDEEPFELIDGERVSMSPQIILSAMVSGRLFKELGVHVETHRLGVVLIEAPFVIPVPGSSNWVKESCVPDVMFVSASRLQQVAEVDPDWKQKPLTIAPDLVVEVISPSDRHSKVAKKVQGYLQDGVRVVWLVEPESQTVTVYLSGSKQSTRLTKEDMLSGGDVIPGFEILIAKLFE
jgi:Uma2 family endonuclease